jgi:chromosome segregation ATPase
MSQTKKQIAEQETISAWSREVVFAWSQWIKGTDHVEIAEWLRAYADSIDPNFANSIETISPRIAQKIREAANDIERLRKLFGDSERLSGRLQETVDQLRERLGGMRIELDEAIRERDEAQRAWDAASDPIDQLLLDELWSRRTDAEEANARIQQLLGVSEQLRAERDEARRLCCRMSAQFVYLSGELCTAKFVADEKGWDCFKEETP